MGIMNMQKKISQLQVVSELWPIKVRMLPPSHDSDTLWVNKTPFNTCTVYMYMSRQCLQSYVHILNGVWLPKTTFDVFMSILGSHLHVDLIIMP